jgi:hypothetical protein
MNTETTVTLTDRLAVFDIRGHRTYRRFLPAGTVIAVQLPTNGGTYAQVTVTGESKTYRAVPRVLIDATAP